ncbi:MAG TPA: heme lyase CcmF/NrfE family subunit [Thermoleophilia bacterium]|nr:heme lyase CcmF/NrfE family subunit [Thermoleophilia bacterium]
MNQVGYTALLLGLMIAAYGVVAPLIGVRTGRREWIKSAENATYAFAGVAIVASAALFYALITRDFSNEYVASYTSRELSWFYTVSAFWAGNSGSMLLWVLLLGVFAAIAVYQNRHKNREILPYVISVLMVVGLFFTILLTTSAGSNPFAVIPGGGPANGEGLNPMLENPGMVIHPVTLYLGYVGFSIPFAFAMGALITKRLGDFWIRSTRRWTIIAWIFLTIGNIVGAWWAYVTLGWGGYWAWDPVENASFMPWLTGTAFLHSVMIQEKKDMLKVWNIILIILTFCLTIFGTFLTRSGVISSVHSFGQSSLGPFFIGFLGLILVFSLNLLFSRLDLLKSRNELDSFVSRESSFLLNNLILVGMAFTVLWGVLFPIISEAVTGNKVTVGPPFFDQVMAPIGLVLMFVTGICPLIAWRRATLANLGKNFMYPAAVGAIAAVLLVALGMRHVYAIISFSLSAFVLSAILVEFGRGAWVRREMSGENIVRALGSLVWRNKRRYGGYTVHVGVILLLVGVTGSYAFKQEASQNLNKGDTISVGAYSLTYDSMETYSTDEKQVGRATFSVKKDGKDVGVVYPIREYYFAKDQPWTRIDRISTLSRDVYVMMLDYSAETGEVNMQVDINPLVSWLWIGGIVMVLGGLLAIWPDRRDSLRLAARYERQARLHEI